MQRRTSREQFDRQARHYDHTWNQWTEESLDWLREGGRITAADRVLDVATGAGFTARFVAGLAARVVGLDVSAGMLREARQRAVSSGASNLEFCQGAAEAIPLASEAFDVVTCRIAPHHFESMPRFLAESRRVLTSAGRLFIVDTTVPDDVLEVDEWQNRVELLRDPSHKRNYSPGEWKRMVEQAGFVVDAVDSRGGLIAMTLNEWLEKSGCSGVAERAVREMFATAPASVRDAFGISSQGDGDVSFHWIRVLLAARNSA
jgi:SAM-dependent methyltransferase